MTIQSFDAWNTIPADAAGNCRVSGTTMPCVALNRNCGSLAFTTKALQQIRQMQQWRAQGNGLLLARHRFDLTGKFTNDQFFESGWQPEFVKRVPPEWVWSAIAAFVAAGYKISVHPSLDTQWLAAVQGVDYSTLPCPYVVIDPVKKTFQFTYYVLDLASRYVREWVVAAAHAIRRRVGVEGVGIDGLEAGLKSQYWRNPQARRETPGEVISGGGAVTDTPFAPGEYETGVIEMLEALTDQGFKMLVNDIARPGDRPADWLPQSLTDRMFGEWRVVAPPA